MLYELKKQTIEKFQIDDNNFVLSMGTSADFEEAVSYIDIMV